MNSSIIRTIAHRLVRQKFFTPGVLALLIVYLGAHGYITYERWHAYGEQQHIRSEHQAADRYSWEQNPDKHPHRMAHFGAFAFRQQHPLSIFDAGLESYMGNIVYLEAHKQNTANFSEASLSTGLIRFGDLHSAMLLYLILPLFIFFIGYDVVTHEREVQTLRLMYIQGADMRSILLGKALGLFGGAACFFGPALMMMWSTVLLDVPALQQETLLRAGLLTLGYLTFFAVLCLGTVLISAWSRGSSASLLTLLGLWLLLFIVVPKAAQAIGSAAHPSPSKLAFRQAIEQEVTAGGDSHNPNDPHFTAIRDSLLSAYGVSDVKDLPFNYGGYLMGIGEEHTATIYARHQDSLTHVYRQQNALADMLVVLSPYQAIKSLSMGLSGTDFETYNSYLLQAEDYRYRMAQYMNKLQMEHIDSHALGSTEGRINVVQSDLFRAFPEFVYHYQSVGAVLRVEWLSVASLALMLILLMALALGRAHTIKVI